MSLSLVGPEKLAPIATNHTGSPFYTRPNVFLHGTTRFAFVMSAAGTRRLRVFKRNNGAGTWAEVDAGGGPAVAGSGFKACPTYIRDPADTNKILIAYPDAATVQLRLVRFDLVAETFGASTSAIGPTVSNTAVIGNNADDTGAKTCVAYRPSTNSDLVLFQGQETIAGVKWLRPYITEYDRSSLTWSITPIAVYGIGATTNFMPLGIVMGADGVAHLFFTEMDSTGTSPTVNNIWHAAISSGLSVINAALVSTDVRLAFELFEGYPRIRTIGAGPSEELLVTYISNAATQALRRAKIARGDASTAPTWTTEVISTVADDSPIGDDFITPTCAIGDDGFPYAFWIGVALQSTFDYSLWYSKGGDAGAGWDTPAALLTLDANTGDFMEFPSVSELPGIGFGIVAMDFQAAAYLAGVEVNAYMEARYTAAAVSGWLPQYRKRVNA